MAQFPDVFDFHKTRFENADNIPVLFGGDFNAVPHTDKGKSPASEKMLSEGFTDAFRSLYPDVEKYPGHSHRSGRRIDQLYYKGKGLKNLKSEVFSTLYLKTLGVVDMMKISMKIPILLIGIFVIRPRH